MSALFVLILAIMVITSSTVARSFPSRPIEFTSPEELQLYLDAMDLYYRTYANPRYGKRDFDREHSEILNKKEQYDLPFKMT